MHVGIIVGSFDSKREHIFIEPVGDGELILGLLFVFRIQSSTAPAYLFKFTRY